MRVFAREQRPRGRRSKNKTIKVEGRRRKKGFKYLFGPLGRVTHVSSQAQELAGENLAPNYSYYKATGG